MLGGVPFRDMKQIDEINRFKLIADHLKANRGKRVAVFVENDKANLGKGDRYIAGVVAELPTVKASRGPGVVPGTETLYFTLD